MVIILHQNLGWQAGPAGVPPPPHNQPSHMAVEPDLHEASLQIAMRYAQQHCAI